MTIVAIDDDPVQLERLSLICKHISYPSIEYYAAENIDDGIQLVKEKVVDLVITDLRLPEGSGIDVLREVKRLNPLISVVIMTAYSDVQEAVEILKEGADDYLVKPLRQDALEKLVLRINEKNILIRESFLPPVEIKESYPVVAGIVYTSSKMATVMQIAARSAESDAIVVVSGESGTGKELIARFIHEQSLRRTGPFVAVNISALAESLAESELFGHRRGAFTGADIDRIGRFELAHGGTLFIDEVGDISLNLQAKLLRAIQFGIIERVGENTPSQLDVRIIAATNRNLETLVLEGRFRKDLFYRINVITIEIPPLRERKEDIPALVDHFIKIFNQKNHRNVQRISREAMNRLLQYDFPGNVRELENIIERAVVLCRGDVILERDLPAFTKEAVLQQHANLSYKETMVQFERSLIEKALQEFKGNKSAAARSLGITERHLRSRLERLNMKPKE